MQLWLIPLLPLAGFAVNGLLGRRLPKSAINAVAAGSVLLSFLWVLKTLSALGVFGGGNPLEQAYVEHYFTWIQSGTLNIGVDFAIDRLTAVMLMIVTGVGFLIHVYAIGYMAHEGGYYRFFAYLNLFMFFMLVLVLAANFLLLFVGWEGVGLCSYLLIGFYFSEKFATDAGNKAFIVNRIGDFGFSLAVFLIVIHFGSLDFATVFGKVQGMPVESSAGWMTAIALLLFVGATGKSAQIPLYVWLPDAMAGPTPVSALIHAATMVTAGVYMVDAQLIDLPARAWRTRSSSDYRFSHRILRRDHGPGADRHQEGLRLLDRFAVRLHVPGPRHRSLFRRHLPRHDARFLQGALIPRSRQRDPRHVRRTGLAQNGRPAKVHTDHLLDPALRQRRHCRRAPVFGLSQ